MNKILELENLSHFLETIHNQKKSIVLTGGVFDILHEGHINFLKEAKKSGDLLIVLVESDENVKEKKGPNRPINSQKNRCLVLSSLDFIDEIIPLSKVTKDEDYDKLIVQIQPSVIALTQGDPNLERRKKQAKMIGANLLEIEKMDTPSTSDLTKNI